MSKAMCLARQARKALKQCDLLRALQSEIQYELSSNPFQVLSLVFVVFVSFSAFVSERN